MKRFFEKSILVSAVVCMLASAVSLSAGASYGVYYGYYMTPGRIIVIVIGGIVVVAFIVKKIINKYKNKDNYSGIDFDISTNKGGSKPEEYMPDKDKIEALAFIYNAGQKTGEKNVQKEGKVMVKCPNCGAPVKFSGIMECEYCKTQITRKSVADQIADKGIKDENEEYNPHKYYDDNITGYAPHDVINDRPNTEVRDYLNDSPYGGQNNRNNW